MSDTTTVTLHDIDVTVTRKGSGPPMLILHGGGGPVSGFPFADKLAEQFELIEPTHPGFNGTKLPDRFDSIDDLAFLYLDLMDALDLKDAIVMGISMGGWTAAEIATMTTDRMSKLILVDAVGIRPGGPTDRVIADIFAMPGPELAGVMWHDPSRAPNPADMTDDALVAMAGNRTALAVYTWDPFMHNPKLQHRLHRIDVPTLIVWGESDGLVDTDYAREYQKLIPGAELAIVPEAGHSPQAEQPDTFVEHIIAFTV